jgi:hypothetical protein
VYDFSRWKIWHYSGSLLHEQAVKSPLELWETSWQPLPVESFAEITVSNKKVAGIKSSQPQGNYATCVKVGVL